MNQLLQSLLLAGLLIACPNQARHPSGDASTSKPTGSATYRKVSAPGARGAAAVREGSGALMDGRRFELVRRPGTALPQWSLASGALGDGPALRSLPEMDGCEWPSIAPVAADIFLGCWRGKDFRVWSDATKATVLALHDVGGTGVRVRAITPTGDLLIEGMCREMPDPSVPDCSSMVVHGNGESTTVEAAGDLRFVAAGAVGHDMYAVGMRPGSLTLFVSRDDGRVFEPFGLPSAEIGGKRVDPYFRGACAMHADVQGNVVVLAYAGIEHGWLRYASTAHGAGLIGHALDLPADSIDLAGARGFAYAEGGLAWETNDAGATWHSVPPPPPFAGHADVRELVACSPTGCLIDVDVVRLGWALP
ncbi:MAG: hypothetical protein NVS3B20_09120 [Polyangiales bacterium]